MSYENYYLLDDMEKYFSNFNREEYEEKSTEELIDICRQYYKEHLPIDVTTWIRVNKPDDKLIYKDGCGEQVCFIRNTICRGLFFYKEYPEAKEERFSDETDKKIEAFQPMVIATHYSKSVTLPVMEINLKSVGVKLLFRYNFYDWNVTVESEKDIDCDFKGVFTDENYNYCYCQGFPKERIYGMYKDNHRSFTCCIQDDYELFTFMWLLRDYLYQ